MMQILQNKTVGIIGAGRIGAAYARMMVEGHKMNLVYFDPYPNKKLVGLLSHSLWSVMLSACDVCGHTDYTCGAPGWRSVGQDAGHVV